MDQKSKTGGEWSLPILALPLLLLLTCAKEIAPPGGPPDTTPPIIFNTAPAEGDTLVPLESKIEIKFSERLEAKSTAQAVFISPPLATEPRIRVKGDQLTIEPGEPLDSNRTYVVTIGATAADTRGNHLANSLSFAFSTGVVIDSAEISGVIYENLRPKRDFSVFAYQWRDGLLDSLFDVRPDYITQTGEKGDFRLRYLRRGEYLVLGVEDKDGDNLISSRSERVALPSELATASGAVDAAEIYRFHVSRFDSSYLQLLTCSASQGEISLRFTGGRIDPASLFRDSIRALDEGGSEVIVAGAAIFGDEPDRALLWSRAFAPDSSFNVRISGLVSESGRPLDSVGVCKVTVRELDETPPQVTARNPEEGRYVVAEGESLVVIYSEPVLFDSGAALVQLDSATLLTLAPVFRTVNQVAFSLAMLPAKGTRYPFLLDQTKVKDWYGNQPSDSTYRFSFLIADPESLGTLKGTVLADPEAPLVIDFTGQSSKLRYRKKQRGGGAFTLALYPDRYQVMAFADENGNDQWDLGMLDPFRFAEPAWIASDTLRIRARFEHSGLELDFR